MKNTTLKQSMRAATLLVLAVLLAVPSSAADITVELAAVTAEWTPPGGGAPITMWGFINDPGNCSGGPADWSVGPRISANAGDNLTINLRNCLDEPASIFVAGQRADLAPEFAGSRMTSLTATAPADGGTSVTPYVWNNVAAGTYLYHSGTNLAKQVHMGLYGALTVDAAPGVAYNGTSPINYDNEVVLLYSEIDPGRHDPPAAAYPNAYTPRYFLINGQAYEEGVTPPEAAGAVNQTTLVRMLSACLDDIVPTIVGMHWNLVAEDGNRYPYPKTQYTALLSALKTLDAIIEPAAAGAYAVFDRRLNLTNAATGPGGMLAVLDVASGALTALNDSASTSQDAPVTIDVLANDDAAATSVDSVTQPANGSAVNNGADVTYAPNAGFAGSDSFTYRATDGSNLSNWATVAVTVSNANDPPVANADAYEVAAGTTLSVAAPGVLANDSDLDGDPLTASPSGTPPAGLSLNPDGSFTYTPAGTAGATETFDYVANDGFVDSAPATVTITVTAAPPNQPPVANADFAETPRNTAVTIVLTGNDTDPDGNLDPTTVVVAGEEQVAGGIWRAASTRGGTVTNLKNGSVAYEPRRNFRGTDTFTYTVADGAGARSAQATVTINVVR